MITTLARDYRFDIDFNIPQFTGTGDYSMYDPARADSTANAFDQTIVDTVSDSRLDYAAGTLVVAQHNSDGSTTTLAAGADYTLREGAATAAGTGFEIDLASLEVGQGLVVTFDTRLNTTVGPNETVTNTASLTWDSLPEDNDPNERDGSASDTAQITTGATVAIEKVIVGTNLTHTGADQHNPTNTTTGGAPSSLGLAATVDLDTFGGLDNAGNAGAGSRRLNVSELNTVALSAGTHQVGQFDFKATPGGTLTPFLAILTGTDTYETVWVGSAVSPTIDGVDRIDYAAGSETFTLAADATVYAGFYQDGHSLVYLGPGGPTDHDNNAPIIPNAVGQALNSFSVPNWGPGYAFGIGVSSPIASDTDDFVDLTPGEQVTYELRVSLEEGTWEDVRQNGKTSLPIPGQLFYLLHPHFSRRIERWKN